MASKKKILIFADWYLPGFKAGGPVKSVSSLVAYLKNDFDFLIITTNTDFGDAVPYEGIAANSWIQKDDSTKVFYASKDFVNRKNMLELIRSVDFDAIYLNSFFSFYFSVLPLFFMRRGFIKAPVLIAPRGMLGSGALQLKLAKKRLFIFISKLIGLHKNVTWHATSEQERLEIEAVFGNKAKIVTVSNLQYEQRSTLSTPAVKSEGELKLFFLSRISPKKNLLFALQLLLNIGNVKKIIFDIYGPVEDELYWAKCLPLIDELKIRGAVVNSEGAIPNNEVADRIASSHFLLLPTLNENYGHVIVESFFNGKPVIISDQTPWRNLEISNAGWDIALNNISKFDSVIRNCIAMGNKEYEQMSGDTIKFAQLHCNSENDVSSTKKMFDDLK